jgi:hypothetical protein
VAPYFEFPARHRSRSGEAGGCAPVSLGVSHHFVKSQNMGSPPTHTIDAALPPASRAYGPEGEMGCGLGIKERSFLAIANIGSSFHEQSLTIPSYPAGWVLETIKLRKDFFTAALCLEPGFANGGFTDGGYFRTMSKTSLNSPIVRIWRSFLISSGISLISASFLAGNTTVLTPAR